MYDSLLSGDRQIEHGFPNIKTIRQSIHALYRCLGSERIMSFASISDNAIQCCRGEGQLIQIQRVARAIAMHLGIQVGTIIVGFDAGLTIPGQVELTDGNDFFIELNPKHKERPLDIAAILAHEVMHIMLHRLRLTFDNRFEDEVLTDTAALYLGIGWPILSVYTRYTWRTNEVVTSQGRSWTEVSEETKLGYLTPEEIGYVLARRHSEFGDTPRSRFYKVARQAYCRGYKLVRRERRLPFLTAATLSKRFIYRWRRHMAPRSIRRGILKKLAYENYSFDSELPLRVVFTCSTCFQRLRVPAHKRGVGVRCPTCLTVLRCDT